VRAESAEEVAAAITRLPGFDLQARVDQNMVVASVVREDSAAAPARAQAEGDQLLPQRARFRAFRPADRPSPSSSVSPSSSSEPPLATPTPQAPPSAVPPQPRSIERTAPAGPSAPSVPMMRASASAPAPPPAER